MGALAIAGEVLAFALKNWKLVALAALIAAVPIAYLAGHGRGDSSGYSRRVAEVAAADLKAELERKGDNAKLAAMSDYDLCVSGLRGSGMPVDACDQLELCWNLGDEADQAALCGFNSMTSIPSWNLAPAMSFGN